MLLHYIYFNEFMSTHYFVKLNNGLLFFFLHNFYRLVEGHVFSFVIGRAFVTDVEKLRIHSKGRLLRVADVIGFFSDITEVCSYIIYLVQFLGSRWSNTLLTCWFRDLAWYMSRIKFVVRSRSACD
jgi:hypothetical protein